MHQSVTYETIEVLIPGKNYEYRVIDECQKIIEQNRNYRENIKLFGPIFTIDKIYGIPNY